MTPKATPKRRMTKPTLHQRLDAWLTSGLKTRSMLALGLLAAFLTIVVILLVVP